MNSHWLFGVYCITRGTLIKEKGTGSTCEKAIIEWIKFFKFNRGLQLYVRVYSLDGFQATEGTAGHREAAESIRPPFLPFEYCVEHVLHSSMKFLLGFCLFYEQFYNHLKIVRTSWPKTKLCRFFNKTFIL